MANAHDLLMAQRAAMMGGKALPYDAEVEYLESHGTEYIDTGIIATQNTIVKSDCTLLMMNDAYSAMWGARKGSRDNDFQVYYNNGNVGGNPSSIVLRTGNNQKLINGSDFGISSGGLLGVRLEISCGSGWIKVNDHQFTTPEFQFTSPHSLCLFCEYTLGAARNFGSFRYYGWSASGDVNADFIPVRVGTVGYMYDRVSGQLFRNAGTGAFVIGPDKT